MGIILPLLPEINQFYSGTLTHFLIMDYFVECGKLCKKLEVNLLNNRGLVALNNFRQDFLCGPITNSTFV